MSKKCVECSKDFIPVVHNQKYCTSSCRDKYYKNPKFNIDVSCKFCGIEFNTNIANKKYCSEICRNDDYRTNKFFKEIDAFRDSYNITKGTKYQLTQDYKDNFDIQKRFIDQEIQKENDISTDARAKLYYKLSLIGKN